MKPTVRGYILSNEDFKMSDDLEIRDSKDGKMIRLDTIKGILKSNLTMCIVDRFDPNDRWTIYINKEETMKAIVVRTKIGNGNTYVATVPCETESKAQEIAKVYTEAFKESRKIIGEDPETVSTSYQWVE